MNVVSQRLLWGQAGLLVLLLVWGWLPLAAITQWGLTLAILLVIAVAYWRLRRRTGSLSVPLPLASLPAELSGALVLVCGDTAPLFAAESDFRATRQGSYVATSTPDSLLHAVQWIAANHPSWVPRLSLMLSIVPELHRDEAALRGQLHRWRRAVSQCRSRLHTTPPLLLCGYFSAPQTGALPIWFVDQGKGVTVWCPDSLAQPVSDWLQAPVPRSVIEARFSHALWLGCARRWLRDVVAEELNTAQAGLPPLRVSLQAVNFIAQTDDPATLWSMALQRETALSAPLAETAAALPFPDALLPHLPQQHGLTPVQRFCLWSGMGLMLFAACAMLASFGNNIRFTRSISDDLRHYRQLSGMPPEPKLHAQQRLREDEQQLARYQRQGAPLPLAMGLYPGGRLYPAVQKAVSDWAPPPAPAPVVAQVQAQTVRLDSLSLFDSGKAVLKPGSTKVLVGALIDIRAKPGWLILVSGHTDATGHAQANQNLSLKRAVAVRDWMLTTSDIPASCFAVQGYGASQPLADNSTPAGRSVNRRVEITLVPEASACQVPEIKAR